MNAFETILTDKGMVIVNSLLHVSQNGQTKLYTEHFDATGRNWKLGRVTLHSASRETRPSDVVKVGL